MHKVECPSCKNEVSQGIDVCDFCEFPFIGTEKEKSIHIGKFISKKGVIFDANESLNKIQKLLFVIVGITLLSLALNFSLLIQDVFVLVLNLAIVLVLSGCAILVKKSPLTFMIIPLTIMLTLYLVNYVQDPRSLGQGILFKCIVIGGLIYAIYLHISSQNFKNKYNL